MRIRHTFPAGVTACFSAALFSIGCSTMEVDPGNKANTATVTVAGKGDKLRMFDDRLRSRLGVGNDDSDTLGCDRCAALRGGSSGIDKLAYYIVRKPETIFRAFGAAWNDVWYDPGDPYNGNDGERLIMTVDINTVDPLCEGFAAPCYYRFNCPAQGYCSQKQSGSCLPACVH